jgi:hypothetical protein
VGVTYPANMFPFVLKNICKKVMPDSPVLDEFYNEPIHQYFKNKNSFGEFVFKQQIKHGSATAKSIIAQFDVNISLEKLLINDFDDLVQLLPNINVSDTESWLQNQNILYRFQYNINPVLQSILGYNSKSTMETNLNVSLDNFDRIMISEFCKINNIAVQVSSFNTLETVNNFFENQKL